jgi:uncharacterized protein (DUF58 family)
MSLQLLAILTAAGGMGMLALTHNAAAEYFMFSALVALMVVTYATSRLSIRALVLRRETSSRVFENEPISVHLEVANRGRFPRFLLDVNDALPEFVEADGEHDFVVPSLWPGERVSLTYTAHALKRGVYSWTPLQLSASDPFGVFQRYVPLDAPGEAVVYPRPVELHGSVSRSGVEAHGQSTGERARGSESGMEFYGIRDYWPGDELRRIHWPATAHHGKLTVIEFDRGASENVAVILDAAAGSEFGSGLDTSFEVAIRAAASLVHWALYSEGIGHLAVASPDGPLWASVDQPQREYEILELLARLRAEAPMPASALVSWAADRLSPDDDVVVITALADDALVAGVSTLLSRRMSVSVLLLDAPSFDAAAPRHGDAVAALRSVGVTVVTLHRGRDLREALSDVLARDS